MSQRINYNQQSGPAVQSLMGLEAYLKTTSIEKNLIHMVKIRVSQLNGCAFCVDMHHKEAKIDGEKELRLYHLTVWHESPLFENRERAALRWAELLTRIPQEGISDEEFKKVREFFSEKEVSDLTMAIVSINAWNRLGVAFRSTPGTMDKLFGLDKAGLS